MWLFRKSIPVSSGGILQGTVDCHSHLLPGVDDGVTTPAESLEILKLMECQGVRKVWFTPHIMEDVPNETVHLQQQFEVLKHRYAGAMKLELAAEYMLDNLFKERLEKDDLLPLQEGKRYLLVETSYFNPPMDLLSVLQRIQQKGYYPLLAHPERYEYMRMADYRVLKEEHISFQLNLPSLVGMYGKSVQEKSEALLAANMYNRFGCDTHSMQFYQRFLQSGFHKKLITNLQRIIVN